MDVLIKEETRVLPVTLKGLLEKEPGREFALFDKKD